MDVRDQSFKVQQAKEQYKDAQKDLKSSYDKNVQQMKETFDSRIEKQAKNYDKHKAKLEEVNSVNNELYTNKTQNAIFKSQEEFKNKLRENTNRFEKERNESKQEFNEKLTDLSSSFKKSLDENDRYQDQIKKSMTERYAGANKRYQTDFNDQITNMDKKFKSENLANREADRKERMGLLKKNSDELEGLRANANDEKFQEVSRLRNDSENLRTTLTRENQLLKDRQEERVAELLKLKGRESEDGMNKFANLQDNIRQKNVEDQKRQAVTHNKEAKDLEQKFNEDVRNIQKIAAQKVRGGTSTDSIKDELNQTKMSYENRLAAAHDEIAKNSKYSTEKEEIIDAGYRTKLREAKAMSVEKIAKNEVDANETLKKANNQYREKNAAIVERYENESGTLKKEADERLTQVSKESRNKIKEQRVEFGRVVNTLNDKSMDKINSLKEDFTKDKTASIEKTKKELNEDKMIMKNQFNHQNNMKDVLYEQRLSELEKQTNKIIENYENKIAQIAKKAEVEVTAAKGREETRQLKEGQANRLAFENIHKEHQSEKNQMRDKYESVIARNEALSEQRANALVQKYEDKLARESLNHQKEMTVRISESQSQFERLFRSSELEKENIRSQYEQRIENMKINELKQDNSKKA